MTETALRQTETDPRDTPGEFRGVSPKGVVIGMIAIVSRLNNPRKLPCRAATPITVNC